MQLDPRDLSETKIYSKEDFPSYLPRLNELYDTLFSGGKEFRGHLVSQIASFAGVDEKVSRLLAQSIEFIHNSSLLHDDLIDQSPLRRGKTAAWKEFGPEYAVLAGDYLLARVIVNLSSEGHIGLLALTSQSISDLLEGEWLQDSIRYKTEVSIEEMDRVHLLKTSTLFSWCLKSPFVYKNYEPEVILKLQKIGENLGLLLQRSDDLLDFNIRNFEGKTMLTDLRAGYLNSFSLRLFKSPEERQKAYKIQNMEDFNQIISEVQVKESLKDFDSTNETLINETLSEAQDLVGLAKIDEGFLELIQEIAPRVYWRK